MGSNQAAIRKPDSCRSCSVKGVKVISLSLRHVTAVALPLSVKKFKASVEITASGDIMNVRLRRQRLRGQTRLEGWWLI